MKQEMSRVKNFGSGLGAEQNEEWNEISGLLFILLFSREREIEV